MHPKQFALISGILLTAVGILMFIPNFCQYAPYSGILPPLKLDTGYGMFLGIFAVNVINKLFITAFGLFGIFCASAPTTSLPKSIIYSRALLILMGLGAAMGLIGQTDTVGGYWPLFGNNVILHGIFALAGAYFGFVLSTEAHRENVRRDPRVVHTPAK